jgi:hypothetical protein
MQGTAIIIGNMIGGITGGGGAILPTFYILGDGTIDGDNIIDESGNFLVSELAPNPAPYLLNAYTGATAGYSLRRLSSTYTGFAIKVQDNVGGATLDVGFNINRGLDTAAIAIYGGVNDVFVETWYDQSGNGNNAVQATSANRPKIYDGATGVVTGSISGKPTIFFDTNHKMPTTTTASTQTLSLFSVAQGNTGRKTILDIGSSNGFDLRTWSIKNYRLFWGDGSTQQNIESPTSSKNETVYSVLKTSTTLNVYLNSSLDGSAISSLYTSNTINISATGQIGGTANISEIVLYTSAANRTGIETNINDFYSIY